MADSGNDSAVFGFCDLLGLTLALPIGDALYRGEPITLRMALFAGIGFASAVFGHSWPRLKSKLPSGLSITVPRVASDFRWWLIVILVGFAFGDSLLPARIFKLSSSWHAGLWGFAVGCLLIVVIATTLAMKPKPKSDLVKTVASVAASTELRLAVGRMTADFGNLRENGYVRFMIVAFPSPWGLKLEGQLSGKVYYEERVLSPDGSFKSSEQVALDTPQLDPSDFGFANLAQDGTWINLRQYVPIALRNKILEALDRLDSTILTFDFDQLVILVSSAVGSASQRLPLWNGLTCRKGMAFGQIKKATATVGIRLN